MPETSVPEFAQACRDAQSQDAPTRERGTAVLTRATAGPGAVAISQQTLASSNEPVVQFHALLLLRRAPAVLALPLDSVDSLRRALLDMALNPAQRTHMPRFVRQQAFAAVAFLTKRRWLECDDARRERWLHEVAAAAQSGDAWAREVGLGQLGAVADEFAGKSTGAVAETLDEHLACQAQFEDAFLRPMFALVVRVLAQEPAGSSALDTAVACCHQLVHWTFVPRRADGAVDADAAARSSEWLDEVPSGSGIAYAATRRFPVSWKDEWLRPDAAAALFHALGASASDVARAATAQRALQCLAQVAAATPAGSDALLWIATQLKLALASASTWLAVLAAEEPDDSASEALAQTLHGLAQVCRQLAASGALAQMGDQAALAALLSGAQRVTEAVLSLAVRAQAAAGCNDGSSWGMDAALAWLGVWSQLASAPPADAALEAQIRAACLAAFQAYLRTRLALAEEAANAPDCDADELEDGVPDYEAHADELATVAWLGSVCLDPAIQAVCGHLDALTAALPAAWAGADERRMTAVHEALHWTLLIGTCLVTEADDGHGEQPLIPAAVVALARGNVGDADPRALAIPGRILALLSALGRALRDSRVVGQVSPLLVETAFWSARRIVAVYVLPDPGDYRHSGGLPQVLLAPPSIIPDRVGPDGAAAVLLVIEAVRAAVATQGGQRTLLLAAVAALATMASRRATRNLATADSTVATAVAQLAQTLLDESPRLSNGVLEEGLVQTLRLTAGEQLAQLLAAVETAAASALSVRPGGGVIPANARIGLELLAAVHRAAPAAATVALLPALAPVLSGLVDTLERTAPEALPLLVRHAQALLDERIVEDAPSAFVDQARIHGAHVVRSCAEMLAARARSSTEPEDDEASALVLAVAARVVKLPRSSSPENNGIRETLQAASAAVRLAELTRPANAEPPRELVELVNALLAQYPDELAAFFDAQTLGHVFALLQRALLGASHDAADSAADALANLAAQISRRPPVYGEATWALLGALVRALLLEPVHAATRTSVQRALRALALAHLDAFEAQLVPEIVSGRLGPRPTAPAAAVELQRLFSDLVAPLKAIRHQAASGGPVSKGLEREWARAADSLTVRARRLLG